MIFSLCTSLRQADHDELANPYYSAQFIGASWIPHFIREMEMKGHQVFSGREILRGDKQPKLDEVLVIGEDRTPEARALIKLGAEAKVNYCLESPLYVPTWYDTVAKKRHGYEHLVGFHAGTTEFPSFDYTDISEVIPWDKRKYMCTVSSNKHYKAFRCRKHRLESPARKEAVKNQLHDTRYSMTGSLKQMGLLDLFGHGWPPEWGKEAGRTALDKIAVMRNYKYALCIENVSRPGYCTEKLIHAMVAGCVPFYLGDHTIVERIPGDLYVRLDPIRPTEDLLDALAAIPQDVCNHMVTKGREWLASESGRLWTYEAFADKMVKLCLDH